MTSSIDRIEYEGMLFGRHLTTLPAGRSRRRGGLLDPSAYVLLSLLEAGGPSTIAELTAATGLDASTLNRQTAALRKAELAERFDDPEGGPARKLRLSEHGQQQLDEERQASRDSLADLVDDWPEEDRSQFAELLARCNRALEERSGRYWPRP
ncbi:MarR family winged helix-turn-helix transcriptional regulator [Promicromonospora sukumoe]|uniref:DNA-binding MarR family transcriptional regulator n=1 Tax=Promicromonospora sukumoe TaxID=88382 RepID=A0A7W3PE90_9MICO|nr:MarR family winged helix-turn-helix transcriptional regulator [Promicromonospora sukumoe]MBA8808815.1 DNA-binding MarR family transcriptional regulator [Promicromonospora sukumoe]